MRSLPLYRALRADKLRIAALEATLESYARGAFADEVPAQSYIAATYDEIKARAERLVERLREQIDPDARVEIIDGESEVGGGAAPTAHLKTALISLSHVKLSSNEIEKALRNSKLPVIGRIVEDRVLLDLRTVTESEEPQIESAILAATS